jgi:hypothetical protein
MIRIKRIYEFLELGKIYPYKEFVSNKNDSWYKFDSTDTTYLVKVYILKHGKKVPFANLSWASEKDWDKPFSDKTSKTINLNDLFKILNTVFKIFFEFMEKRNIEYGQVGSCSKNKFKVYKQIIEEENDYEIVRENSEIWDSTRTLYYIDFKRKNYIPTPSKLKTRIRKIFNF